MKFPDNPTKGEKQNTKQKVFPVLSVVTYHLSTQSEVITGKSQTEALMTDISQKLLSLFIMDRSLRSIKTNNWPADNLKTQDTSTSCTLEPAIQSGDTGQWIPFYSWQFTITWILIRMSPR